MPTTLHRDSWEQYAAIMEAENKRLRAALKPFAEAGADAEGYPDDHPVGCDPAMQLAIKIEDGAFAPLKVSHLRAAHRALSE